MLTKRKVIPGLLVFMFFSGFSSAVIAGDSGIANVYRGERGSINIMRDDGVEIAYSPMTVNSDLASACPKKTNSEDVEFDASPRKNNIKDSKFDCSPRLVKCGPSYC